MLCISAVASFSLIQKGMAVEGFILVIIANIGMEGGFAFYNSFLPEITEKEYHGRVSAWGYAVGYAGSILSLVLALTLINRGYFDLTWLMISAFFGIFSLPAFLFLPADRRKESGLMHAASKGMRDTWMTFKRYGQIKRQGSF